MPIRRVNHVVLCVSDLPRSTRFYTEVLGLRVIAELPGTPHWPAMVFLRTPHETTNHHDIGLIANATPPAPGDEAGPVRPGLFHVALEVGTVDELAEMRDRFVAAGALGACLDQGMHLSVYGQDPDGIQLEIIWRVPDWSDDNEMGRAPLDLDAARARWGGRLPTGAAAGTPA